MNSYSPSFLGFSFGLISDLLAVNSTIPFPPTSFSSYQSPLYTESDLSVPWQIIPTQAPSEETQISP